jgi:hypothetical protein
MTGFRIEDLQKALSEMTKEGCISASVHLNGSELVFVDYSAVPIVAVGIRRHDVPMGQSGRLEFRVR